MKEGIDRGYKYVVHYRNEIGGSMTEAAQDLITDILLMIRDYGTTEDAEEISRLAWSNYESEIMEGSDVA